MDEEGNKVGNQPHKPECVRGYEARIERFRGQVDPSKKVQLKEYSHCAADLIAKSYPFLQPVVLEQEQLFIIALSEGFRYFYNNKRDEIEQSP
jgi:hypothetical protein